MRIRVEVRRPDGTLSLDYYITGAHFMTEALSGQSVKSILITHLDGSTSLYERPEYECDWCGEYGHAIEACPDINPDDVWSDGEDTWLR